MTALPNSIQSLTGSAFAASDAIAIARATAACLLIMSLLFGSGAPQAITAVNIN